MSDEGVRWWPEGRLGCISLAISLVEILVIGSIILVVQISRHEPTRLMETMVGDAWLVGGFGSFGFMVAGLFADSDQTAASLAMIVAIVVGVLGGLQLPDWTWYARNWLKGRVCAGKTCPIFFLSFNAVEISRSRLYCLKAYIDLGNCLRAIMKPSVVGADVAWPRPR
jgi:hypothetical protein